MCSSLWFALDAVLVPVTSNCRQDQAGPTAGILQLVLPGAQQDTLSSATGRTVALCEASSFTRCLCDAGVWQEGDQSPSVGGGWGYLPQGLVALANSAVSGVSEVTWIHVGSW